MKLAILIAALLIVAAVVVLILRHRAASTPALAPAPVDGLPVKVVLHTEPFQFTGVDTLTIMGSPMVRLSQIPFTTSPVVIRQAVLPKDKLVNLRGDIADEIHIFNPPGGTDGSFATRKFLFREGVLIGLTMGIDSVYLDRLIAEVVAKR